MFSTSDGLELGTGLHISGVRTDLIQELNAKPKYVLKTNANLVSNSDIYTATNQTGSYMYDGITKPTDRLIVSRLQPGDQVLLVHSAPMNMAGAHAIVEIAGQPEKYFDENLRRPAHRVPLRYVRTLDRMIPMTALSQLGRSLEIDIFNERRRLMIDQITETQFNALLELEGSEEETGQEATEPSRTSFTD